MAADAEQHGGAAFDEDAEDGTAAAAGTLEGLLGSMVGAIGELAAVILCANVWLLTGWAGGPTLVSVIGDAGGYYPF
jgi:hypothetical protein